MVHTKDMETTQNTKGLKSELPKECRYLYTWHKGTPEARTDWRTAPTHDPFLRLWAETGIILTECSTCGAVCGEY